ncbi:probable G-protein coupled receptor 82 [Myxocyprinus asiaticus]|uniref:probable G-protein coupled receptor 82 n=1 Tax=Myxocyprinus asiaticus TaxID=70543 RepID=UPI002223D85F|nr:probable G-protein coupled receptor 82 [Myxocyprinus asiaticus]XP_051565646.1 probable G-protein coupled receptor 82 [Myxocyprinus asiaticus]XP_051565648.1 probable G-protein coupled receptor 82 [Myxocyprinus asiaticus]
MANSSQVGYNTSYLCQTSTTTLVLPIVYTLMFITGLPGNVLSLWVFLWRIAIKTSTHIYLINLSISNLLLCLTMPFLAVYYALGTIWNKHDAMCQVAINGLTPVLHINICIGVMILSWVALSRFASLIQHSHANRPSRWLKVLPGAFLNRKRHAKLAYALCLITWAIVALAVIPFVVLYSIRESVSKEDNGDEVCYSVAVEIGGAGSHIFALVAVSLFFMFFLLVLISYMAVIRHIWRSKKSAAISDSQRVYTRVFRNIVVIKLVLVVCLLPHHIYKAIFIHMVNEQSLSEALPADVCHPLSMHVEVKNILLCLASLRCSTDPIMYFLLDKMFRKHSLGLLRVRTSAHGSQSSKSNGGQYSQPTTGGL